MHDEQLFDVIEADLVNLGDWPALDADAIALAGCLGGGREQFVALPAGGGGGITTFNVADVTGNATSDFNVNAIINNLGGTASAFTKTGLGTMTLTAANTFSGTTTTVAATMAHGLARTKGRYGMVTMCVGGGMGAAGIFENLQR